MGLSSENTERWEFTARGTGSRWKMTENINNGGSKITPGPRGFLAKLT